MGCWKEPTVVYVPSHRQSRMSRLYRIFVTLLLVLCILPTASALMTRDAQSRSSGRSSPNSPSGSAALPPETAPQSSVGTENGVSDCTSADSTDGDYKSENGGFDADIDLEQCLVHGREFVTNYLKSLRKPQRHKFDRCSQYNDIVSCIRSHLSSLSSTTSSGEPCQRRHSRRETSDSATKSHKKHRRRQRRPHRSSAVAAEGQVRSSSTADSPTGRRSSHHHQLLQQLRDWVPIVTQMDGLCAGENSSKSVTQTQQCVEEELQGMLSKHCDELYLFNINQHTRHECHFVRELLHCKEALVTSACGDEAGNFAFSIVKISERHASKHGCSISRERNYTAFRYDSTCQRDIIHQVMQCTSRHLTEKSIAKFHAGNDLIALGSERQLRQACSAFTRYTRCIKPVKTQCGRGVKRLLDHEGDLRRYVLKMERICNESVINVYASSLNCYQDVMTDGTLEQCDNYWMDVSPWLGNITSYQFYCEPNHTNTGNLLIELQKLHMCHGAALANECGQNASLILSDLVHAALHDPLYLRLDFRADCELHRPQVLEVAAPAGDSVRTLRPTHAAHTPTSTDVVDASDDEPDGGDTASGSQSTTNLSWRSTTTNEIGFEDSDDITSLDRSARTAPPNEFSASASSRVSGSPALKPSPVSIFLTVAVYGVCFVVTRFRKSINNALT